MFKQPNDYAQTASFGQSDFKPLPKGGYIVRVLQIEETKDKKGKPMIHFAFDISDGEYNSYFMNLFNKRKERSDNPLNVKYPFEGQMWIPVYDYEDPNKTSRKFKGFCTALEDSGTEVWSPAKDFMIDSIKSATLGIVFQSQEQEYNGKASWRSVPWGCRSVESILSGDYFVPDDKPLPEKSNNSSFSGAFGGADSFAQAEDELPF